MLCKKLSLIRLLVLCCLAVSSIFIEISKAYATSAFDVNRARSGHVLARGLVLENDLPIWAQYNDNGETVGAEYPYASNLGSYALSADVVNASHEALEQLKAEFGDRIVVMSREQYSNATLKTGLKQPIDKLYISGATKSVVFLEPTSLVSAKQHSLLLRARFDLNAVSPAGSNTRSLLLNSEGRQIAQSQHNFAFKSAFFEGDGGKPPTLGDLSDKVAYAPFKGSFVEVMAPYGGMAVTEDDGRWVSLYRLVPCPMFFFEYNTPAFMSYYYANFNPKVDYAGFDYQVLPGYDFCIGYDALPVTDLVSAMVKVAVIGIQASIAIPFNNYNFFVDTNILGGQAEIYDPFQNKAVPIGAETKYIYREPEIKANEKPLFYFDGDELAEYTLYGAIDDNGEFVCKKSIEESQYYGVYLSSNGVKPAADCSDEEAELQQPDLVRVVDIVADIQPQGLLESLNTDDLRDTDIFVFRESTGMLLTQRKGKDLRDGMSFYDVIKDKFSYQLHIRGPKTLMTHVLDGYKGEEGFVTYQGKSHMNPELHRRDADHLKPNEMLRIILINRKTGYIGSKLRTFSDIARQNATMQEVTDFKNITRMYPPNLKVTAERIFTPNANSVKTGQQKNLVSYEGSALSTDSMLVITTEWFDHDGSPLPSGLADYGYTGRLAKVAGNNALVTVGGQLANFAIKPGRNIVQINLPGGASSNEHFYVNVSGEPISESPSFEEIGAGDGPLAHRPKYYVPIKVPVFDEELTTELNYKYKKAVNAGDADDLTAPGPVYHYVYRPEYQFSTYELKVNDILRKTADDNVISLYPKERPLIGSSDDMVTMMYDLLASNSDALAFLGEGQELVFALGADEIKATIGESGQVRFERLDHIAALDVEDFVTLSLYNNTDPTNVLWDYAFEAVALDTRWAGYDNIGDDGTIYVSADDPVVPLQSLIVGYANRENKTPVEIKWDAKGSGSFINLDNNNAENGVFAADIQLPPYTGTRATPFVYFAGDKDNYVIMDAIEVVPGVPDTIDLVADGEAFISGYGEITVDVTVTDKNGNLVADGTAINFSLDGVGIIASSDDETKGGKASATIIGGESPEESLTLTVQSGDAKVTHLTSIAPLVIEIDDYPTSMDANEQYQMSAKVTTPDGEAARGVYVNFGSNVGKLTRTRVMTNGEGKASTFLFSGFNELNDVQLTARVGLVPGVLVGSTVKAKPIENKHLRAMHLARLTPQQKQHAVSQKLQNTPRYASTTGAMVVGNEVENGIINHVRDDSVRINLPYQAITDITLNGAEGLTQQLILGTMAEPNLQPIAGYAMDALEEQDVAEFNNLHPGLAKHIVVTEDHPLNIGTSFKFSSKAVQNPEGEWESSRIVVPLSARFKVAQDVGFRIDLKATTTSGEIFNLEGGAQGLTLNEDASLTYYLHTTQGKASVTTPPIELNKWSTVAGRYQNGQLTLEVDGQRTSVTANGELVYSVTQRGLTIGQQFNGAMSNFKMFDWSSAPLLQFANASGEMSHTFLPNELSKEINLHSTGAFNQDGQTAKSQRIGINIDGYQYFVSVIDKEYFRQMALLYVDINKPDGYPPYDPNYQAYTPFPLISVAHAGLFDFDITDYVFEAIKLAIGLALPIDEGKGLAMQIYYAATGSDNFDPLELTLNAIGVLTVIPIAKPLLPVVKVLNKVLVPLNKSNPKFIKSIGGVMGKVADELMDNKYDTLWTLMPFLLIAGEMALDEEAREGLTILVKSIASSDDLLAWMEYLSLPADGWEGDGDIPDVELTASTNTPQSSWTLLYDLVPNAYASNPLRKQRKRIQKEIGVELKKTAEDLGDNFKPEDLSKAIRAILKGIKKTDFKQLRGLVSNRKFLTMAIALQARAATNFKTFLKGESSARISPKVMVGVIWYLEKSMADETLGTKGSTLQSRIRGIYGNAFKSVFTKGVNLTNQAHGGMYHLAKIAQYHFESQMTGAFPQIIAVEALRNVQFYNSKGRAGESKIDVHDRKVDIVLAYVPGSGHEVWVELKSLSNKHTFSPWTYGKKGGGGKASKEVVVDRAAQIRAPDGKNDVTYIAKDDDDSEERVVSVDLQWRFQVFDVKATSKRKRQWSFSKNQLKNRLTKLDENNKGTEIKTTLKKKEIDSAKFAKMDDISAWLVSSGAAILESLQ